MIGKQSYVQNLMTQCQLLSKNQQKQSQTLLFTRIDQIYNIFFENIKESLSEYSNELIVKFMELTCEIVSKRHYAVEMTAHYFQKYKSFNQFYIRALLVKATLIAQEGHLGNKKGEDMVMVLKDALSYTTKALDIITGVGNQKEKGKDVKGGNQDNSKQKYAFLIFNVSTCIYKIIRFMLKSNWQRNFTEIVQRICKLFDEIDESNHDWRCRYNLILHQCLYDSDKKPDSYKILDQLWERTKVKPCDFQDELFKLRVHLSKENGALVASIKKDLEGNGDVKGWKILEVLQRIKSGLIPEPQIEKELMNAVNSISSAVLIGNESSANKLSPLIQDRLAETGRVALLYNHINIADSITNFLNKVRQLNQKAMILNEYNKAELLIQKKGPEIDNKTGMKLNSAQLKVQEIERRSQALKILQKACSINKRQNNAQLIYEGCILIWNIALPLMVLSQRDIFTKSFQLASQLLQQIDSNDHLKRIQFHLQLSKTYFNNESNFSKVQQHILKAMKLDSTIPRNKISYKYNEEEDLSLYQRPYSKYIEIIYQKSNLKKHHQERMNDDLDKIIVDLWNVVGQKSENTKIDILQKSLGNLVNIEPKEYDYEDAKKRLLVDEEIKEQLILLKQNNLRIHKKKKLLAAEIAELAFEWEINELAESACEIVIQDKWEPENALEMILSQVKCYYFLGQIYIDHMIKDNFEIAFTEPLKIDNESTKEQLTQANKQQIFKRKEKIFKYFSKGIQLANSIKQSWLIFNGAIYIWNNFLHIFKNPINDSKLISNLSDLIKQLFQTMKNNLKDSNKKIVSYDSDIKGQIFANIGLIYARQMENIKQFDQVNKICEALSLTQLSPHTRKLINSIKSRVTTVNKGGNVGTQKQTANKGNKEIVNNGESGNDVFLFEIVSQIEIIKNSVNRGETGGLIRKCYQSLQNWKPRENDETDLQLHAELWTRLARLALNQDTTEMFKYSIKCVENSLLPSIKTSNAISSNRLRWYSLAEYTYGESLFKMINLETQDIEVYEKLLFEALNHTIEAVEKGFKCNINILVLDASKQVWNICSRLQQSALNRKNLIKPIYHCLTCLKLLKQKSQVDLLLLLSQLLFKSALENKQYKIGETTADMLFQLIPKNMQKSLWQAKMIFMSKQGKNELQAISNMKEVDISLQSKLWIKLARSSTIINKQYAAYNKSIEILRKEGSVEIVEVLIQYSEWQLRVNKESHEVIMNNLLLAADYLIDIEYGEDEAQDNLQDDKVTIFSRSSRGRKSQISNQQSFKSKQTNNKKQMEKKAVISNKSKGSRMNRTAKIANTIKSKNTKSIFVHRQQESNPESLNCSHYEKLFRIHTLLALISKTTQDRIKYSLDAKHFLIKILQISFRTLNVMDENAAKYTNTMQQKKTNQQYIKKYKIPAQLQDWIKLILPKQFMEKVKTLEDYNFMGIYMFEKPQLTFNYIEELLNIFERYGYLLHTIPIFFFMKFVSKEIINNTELHQMCDMKLVRVLKRCGFTKELYETYEITKFKLNDTQKKNVLNKTNSLKYQPNESVSIDTLYQVPNEIPLPNLIKPYNQRQYQIWTNIALELFNIGQINNSKQLLKQALIHCKILKDIKTMDKCYLGLMKIALIEGEMVEALNLVVICNKMCRDVKNWQTVYEQMFNILLALHKFDELKKFSESICIIISKLIEDVKKHKKVDTSHQHQYLQLQHFLSTCVLLNIKLSIQQYLLIKQQQKNGTALLESINRIYGDLINQSNILLFDQYQTINKTFSLILTSIQQGLIQAHNSQFGISLNNKIMNILLKLQTQIMNSGKYCLIGVSEECFRKYNPMIKLQYKVRLCIGRSYNIEGLLKKAGNVEEIRKKMERISLLQGGDRGGEEQVVKKQETKGFEPLKKYLQTLTIKIQKDMAPIQKRLDSYQASISLLRNLQNKIQQNTPEEIELGMLLMSAERKRAALKQQLGQIWAQTPNLDDHQDKFDANESLHRSDQFIFKYQSRCGDILQQPNSFAICRRVYIEMVENRGRIFSDKTFEYLVKYQHFGYLEKLKRCFTNWLQDNNSIISYERLLRKIPVFNQGIVDQINKISLFQSLTKFPSYSQAMDILPNNSAMVLLSLSLNKNEIYFGMYSKVNSLETGQPPVITYNVRKIQLAPKMKIEISDLEKEFTSIKSTLAKIPINEQQKYSYLVEEMEVKCKKAMDRFEELQGWWAEELKRYLNTSRPEPSVIVDPKDAKKQTKQPPKNAKKGGKDELSSYQSPLIPSPSGVQSITLLIDFQLFNFPFQNLSCFSNIPSLSRDTSLFFLSRKYQSLNYKPQLNNSDNFGIDKSKYICYDYKTAQQNGESTFLELSKVSPLLKFDGISSSKRLPSLGEYQQIMSSSNVLHIYGSLSFVNTLKFQPLVSNIPTNKLRLIIINDNINNQKSTLNKFFPIQNGEVHPIEEEDIDTVHIMNLMNITVVKTRWSVDVEENKKGIRELYREGCGGVYLGAGVKKVIMGRESGLGKLGMFLNGPANVRLG